ncbi:hypothetical protein FQN54_007576 [Arachnomyces sp. PD_36]|nr:hypothetical protein FQN54_007576 [Arachnomyces sp. PD_36]
MLDSERDDDLAGSPRSIGDGDTQEQPRVSRFLNLPRELRDEIYHLVLGGRAFRLTFSRHRTLSDADEDISADDGELLCTTSSRYLSERRDPLELAEGEVENRWDDFNFRGYDYNRDLKREKRMFVGAMPLLLVCRQVYNESVELLYSRNTFQFHQAHLMPDVFSYIPPNRLAAITSLELLLESSEPWRPWRTDPYPSKEELIQLDSLALKDLIEPVLSTVESSFPNLRKLYLATNYKILRRTLQDIIRHPWAAASYADANEYLTLLDKFADKSSPRLQEFEFVPQRSMYVSLVRRSFPLNGGPNRLNVWWLMNALRLPIHSVDLPAVLRNPRYLIRTGFNDLLYLAGTSLATAPLPVVK